MNSAAAASPIRALLLDMDGLLIDSERVTFGMWQKLLRERGYELTLADYCALIGHNDDDTARLIAERFPGVEARSMIYEPWDAQYERIAPLGGVPLKEGVAALLDWADSRGLRKAVVSSNSLHWIDTILRADGVLHRMDAVIHGGMPVPGKPQPDLFLLGAKTLGLSSAECLVLEDSDAGLRAGSSAGMRVVCVPDLQHPSPECEALCWHICGSLCDIPALLEAENAL